MDLNGFLPLLQKMKSFLTLKHWQLVALVIIPALLDSIFLYSHIISGIIILLWISSIGYYGQERIILLGLKPMNFKLFAVSLIFLPFFILLSGIIVSDNPANDTTIDILNMFFGLYCGFAIFQVLFFASKMIVTLEYEKEVGINDYLKTVFQIVVFILGIWNLQPRINQIFKPIKSSL